MQTGLLTKTVSLQHLMLASYLDLALFFVELLSNSDNDRGRDTCKFYTLLAAQKGQ